MRTITSTKGTERSTIQGLINQMGVKCEADLKLLVRLLPELYITRSNYYLIVFKTNFKI